MAGSQTHRAGGQAEVGLGFSSRLKRSVCVCVCVCRGGAGGTSGRQVTSSL